MPRYIDLDQYSILTASDATEDNRTGPGASVDRVLTWLKPKIERFISRLAARRECNPDVLVANRLREFARYMPNHVTRHCAHQQTARDAFLGIPKRATYSVIVETLLRSPALECAHCRDVMAPWLASSDQISKMCKTLTRMVKNHNISACSLAIAYMTMLSCVHDEFLNILCNADLRLELNDLLGLKSTWVEQELLPPLPILRRARVAIFDTEMLTRLKEFKCCAVTLHDAGQSVYHHDPTSAQRFHDLIDVVVDGLQPLLAMLRQPSELSLPVLRYIATFMWSPDARWVIMSRPHAVPLEVSATLWSFLYAAASDTDATTAVLTERLLTALYGNISYVRSRSPESSIPEMLWSPLLDIWKAEPSIFGPGTPARTGLENIFSKQIGWNLRLPDALETSLKGANISTTEDHEHPLQDLSRYLESPIFGVVEIFTAERLMRRSYAVSKWYGVPRALPREVQQRMFQHIAVIAQSIDFQDLEYIRSRILDIRWDIVSRQALGDVLRQHPELRDRQPELMGWLARNDIYDPSDLQCTGIVVGRVVSDSSGVIKVYDDHCKDPLPCIRDYTSDAPLARLLAPFAGFQHLFWVPWSEIHELYQPLAMYARDRSARRRYIGQFREGGIDGGLHTDGMLLFLDDEHVHQQIPGFLTP